MHNQAMSYRDSALQAVSSDLPWTGERYLPSVGGIIELEHVHRYLIAKELARDKDVLDIASGEGYGSAMLAEVARSVIGVDNSEHAVAHAATTYPLSNLAYRYGACEAIPLEDGSVDLVVSFETIEHHDQHRAMMAEIRRVLRPGGFLIISSPDKYEYSDRPNYRNPYHVKELYRREFEALLSEHFRHVAYLGQRVVFGSAIFHSDGGGRMLSFRREGERIVGTPGISRPIYLIAVASDAEPPALPCGMFVESFDQGPTELQEEVVALTAALSEVAGHRDSVVAERDVIRAELARMRCEEDSIRARTAAMEAALDRYHHSTSWRLTAPVRWLGRGIRALRRGFAMLARRIYWAMPLSIEAKLGLKSRLFRVFGPGLGRFESYRAWQRFEDERRLRAATPASDETGKQD